MGVFNKIKGAAKKIEGKLTGDRVRQAQGSIEETKGDMEIKGRRTANRAKAGARNMANKVAAKVQRGASRARSRTR